MCTRVSCYCLSSLSLPLPPPSLCQLSLWINRWDNALVEEETHEGAKHVRVLWFMPKHTREKVLGALVQSNCDVPLVSLELGGRRVAIGDPVECPMQAEELWLLLPDHLPLKALQCLFLQQIRHMDDTWLRALAQGGCGACLTSLSLCREFFPPCTPSTFSFLSFFFLLLIACAELGQGVTDEGLCALAQGGCGSALTSLTLDCLCDFFFLRSGWFFYGRGSHCLLLFSLSLPLSSLSLLQCFHQDIVKK